MYMARRCEMTRGLGNSQGNSEGRRDCKVARNDVGKGQERNHKGILKNKCVY